MQGLETRRKSPFNLPLEAHVQIIKYLSVNDLLKYKLVDKVAQKAVKELESRALQIKCVLEPYFNSEDIERFRTLQYTTGLLISGSTALSFFTREVYSTSDLDLYIEVEFSLHVAYFLISCGYKFEPSNTEWKQQPERIEEAVEDMYRRFGTAQPQPWTHFDGRPAYSWNGIGDVWNFVRGEKKIQVIACAPTPLSVILGFHSTVVMNVIGYAEAISFYPQITFCDMISLKTSHQDVGNSKVSAYEKYHDRGWDIVDEPPSLSSFLDPISSINCRREFRRPGDRRCWTVRLRPVEGFHPTLPGLGLPAVIRTIMWKLEYPDYGLRPPELTMARVWQESKVLKKLFENWDAVTKIDNDVLMEDVEGADEVMQAYINDKVQGILQLLYAPLDTKLDSYEVVNAGIDSMMLQWHQSAVLEYPGEEGYKLPPVESFAYLQVFFRKLFNALEMVPKVSLVNATDRCDSVWFNIHVMVPDMLDEVVEEFLNKHKGELILLKRYAYRMNLQIKFF
ncbi:hypothetical protein L218DRAFT_907716 [Marasmius fiardii PR-910]|nr:hypothetical protein L218DRAFT_907716 [Marasmius fiardii PR-910]